MSTTSRGAPYPDTTDGNNAPADLEALAGWVNDRPGIATLTTTQRNALAGADLWAGRHIWNSTTSRLEFYNGTIWAPTPLPGRTLAFNDIPGPITATSTSISISDIDATNAAVTFNAPASGAVHVDLEGVATLSASVSDGNAFYWGLRQGSTAVGQALMGNIEANRSRRLRQRVRISVDGLTPGQSYTWKWGHFIGAAITGNQVVFTVDHSNFYTASMRVIEA